MSSFARHQPLTATQAENHVSAPLRAFTATQAEHLVSAPLRAFTATQAEHLASAALRWGPAGAIYDRGMAHPISRDDVAHVARLARLDLTDEELERFTGQLGRMLGRWRGCPWP